MLFVQFRSVSVPRVCPVDYEAPLYPHVTGDVLKRGSIGGQINHGFELQWCSSKSAGGLHFPRLTDSKAKMAETLDKIAKQKESRLKEFTYDVIEHKLDAPDAVLDR